MPRDYYVVTTKGSGKQYRYSYVVYLLGGKEVARTYRSTRDLAVRRGEEWKQYGTIPNYGTVRSK